MLGRNNKAGRGERKEQQEDRKEGGSWSAGWDILGGEVKEGLCEELMVELRPKGSPECASERAKLGFRFHRCTSLAVGPLLLA